MYQISDIQLEIGKFQTFPRAAFLVRNAWIAGAVTAKMVRTKAVVGEVGNMPP